MFLYELALSFLLPSSAFRIANDAIKHLGPSPTTEGTRSRHSPPPFNLTIRPALLRLPPPRQGSQKSPLWLCGFV